MTRRIRLGTRDHPRVCGEHVSREAVIHVLRGSSPRMRGAPFFSLTDPGARPDHPRVCGEHTLPTWSMEFMGGSSPRMRGALLLFRGQSLDERIIPAYAGSTIRWMMTAVLDKDHPRVCGEHPDFSRDISLRAGSSPRMRGAPVSKCRRPWMKGIIPAYAGSTVWTNQ